MESGLNMEEHKDRRRLTVETEKKKLNVEVSMTLKNYCSY